MPIRLGGLRRELSKVGFRGDNRLPRNIILSGFESQDRNAVIRYRPFREEIEGFNRPRLYDALPGDIDPTTGVTFSARFLAASLFPLRESDQDPAVSDTYIYGVVVDTGIFDTFSRQVLQGLP
jgi:hypothetical protein